MTRNHKVILFIFLLSVFLQLIAYNRNHIPREIVCYPPTRFFIFFIHDQYITDKIYFLGKSISDSLVYLAFAGLAKPIFEIHLLASAWFGVSTNDVYDEIMDDNIVGYPSEYYFLLFTFFWVIYKLHTKKFPEHRVWELLYRLRDWFLIKLFGMWG